MEIGSQPRPISLAPALLGARCPMATEREALTEAGRLEPSSVPRREAPPARGSREDLLVHAIVSMPNVSENVNTEDYDVSTLASVAPGFRGRPHALRSCLISSMTVFGILGNSVSK